MSKSSKKGKKGRKKGKSKRVSIRDQLRAAKSGENIADSDVKSDPIGSLDSEWYKNAKEADKWKPKWECMQTLMGYCCGDSFGNKQLPHKYPDNNKAGDVIAIFAKWLNDENHIFTRQHILKLLIPFSHSYLSKQCWKKANKLAEGIILKQWAEKKHGFLQLVTPALIAVYSVSGSQLKKWKDHLIQSMDSPQGQVRMSCWDFLSKICILSKTNGKLKNRGPKDVELFINDNKIISYLKNTILNDKEKDVRDACAKFIYGAKQICNKVNVLDNAYKQIREDKRASMALDIASDLYKADAGQLPTDASNKKKEIKLQKKKKKQASSRKNNMRAMIAKAKKESAKTGGGGNIDVQKIPSKSNKFKKIMNKYDDDDSDDDSDDKSNSDNEEQEEESSEESQDSELEREREREKKKKERERQRKEKEKERERKRKEKEKERARKKKEQQQRERERQRAQKEKDKRKKKHKKKYISSSESESESESEESDNNNSNNNNNNEEEYNRRGNNKKNKRINNSRTDTIDDKKSSAKTAVSNQEIDELSLKVDKISQNVQSVQKGMNGMERKMNELAKNSESKSGMSSKTEEKIMKILAQLQKDVKIMKNDISYIKACWEDAESVPSDQ